MMYLDLDLNYSRFVPFINAVAQRVVDRGGHRFMNNDISVSLVSRIRSTQSSETSNFSEGTNIQGSVLDEQKAFTKSVKTIKVRGVNKVSNRESVLWYFENKKSCCADIGKSYTDDEDDDVMYIEYKEESSRKIIK
ncbi:hypothetical protein DPMN_010764 [Dreissena polymorpha]|uniref:Uncharacterized protein n=1 Tax=Dreissena polymorpha TaxID=45954 RepID=A0A9D4N2U6_DREPO|nr:hypothetical protein DPMN_010764 [Dreissena polymorpha]